MDNIDEQDKLNEAKLQIKEVESLSKIILNAMMNKEDGTENEDAANAVSILTEKLSAISLLLN